ncbi:triple tyrosine motif-containing protein [Terrimonas rubra]|uniref:Triple tyrosine motif-containing protein n=1 Tax=Terrimonas rubra TaxID=1035890 RepID=A0ABW6A6L9_9BACT
MKIYLTLFLLLWGTCLISGQNTIGLPDIINYPKQTYKAGTQNWGIAQDKNNLLYFANNEGIVSFDGAYWKTYPVPNKTITRSVAVDSNNTIYVGAQNEIGYFEAGENGQLTYKSLKPLIPEKNRSITDVWDIICHKQSVFFRATEAIFELRDNHINVYPAPIWLYIGKAAGNNLIAQEYSNGIVQFDNGTWTRIVDPAKMPEGYLITASLPVGQDSTLIVTLKNGLYLYHNRTIKPVQSPQLNVIANYHIYDATLVDENTIALATSTHGCIIIDKNLQTIQSFSRQEGLQNNNILSVFTDKHKNIWLGLDNGIDFIAYNSAIKNIQPETDNDVSGYSAIIYQKQLYLATTNGVYTAPLQPEKDFSFSKGVFEKVNNARGQTWNLSIVNNQLLAGHHEGLFTIQQNQATLLDKTSGFWSFLPLSSIAPSPVIVAGTYHGIRLYDYVTNSINKAHIEVPFESSRFVAIHNNIIWVSHPYKGVYRVDYQNGSPTVKAYNNLAKHGLGESGNYIFKIKDQIIATTEQGIFEYSSTTDKFIASAYFNAIFGKTIIRYLKEDAQGNLWFVYDKNLGVVDFSGPSPRIIYIAELNGRMVSGFEQVYPANEHNIFVGGEKGYFHINYAKYKQQTLTPIVQLRSVLTQGKTDSLIFGGYAQGPEVEQPTVPYHSNSFYFQFSSPFYEQQSNIEYSYFLRGYDKKWSDWNNKTEKEYTYLPAGTYTFYIKARNNLGNVSEEYSYSFTILPPWYFTWWAYSIYCLVALYGLYLLYKLQKRKFARQRKTYEEEQKRLQYLHQLEVDKYAEEQNKLQYQHQIVLEQNEKEIISLKNEKLESEIQFKNKEMASTTMHLLKKGELIHKLKEELQQLSKNTSDENALDAFKRMIKSLNEEEKTDKDWEHFTIHFDKVHNDFFIALKAKHDNLTANELKLCAFLRMNLSTKEIAQLMNISVRGVEISRYRLRKKLNIPTETNLFTYFLDFHTNGKREVV